MERDLHILRFIGLAQPVTTAQVMMLTGGSLAVTRRRLRVLRDHHLVRVVVLNMAGENLYLLTAGGRARLDEERDDAGSGGDPAPRVLRAVPRSLDHHLPSATCAAALTAACEASGYLAVTEYLMERDIRATLGTPQKNVLIPDATVVLTTRLGASFAVAIEVDTGSEKNPSWVAEHKGRGYAQLHSASSPLRGQSSWCVAFLVPSLRRLHRLASAIFEAELPLSLFYFALTSDLSAESVLKSTTWQSLRLSTSENRVRLRGVSPFTMLMGRARLASRSDTSPGPASAQHHDDSQVHSRDLRDHGVW